MKKIGKFKATQRSEGICTSDVILRIIKDYDMYVFRNLEKGYTPKEMGISGLKMTGIKLQGGL